jgi:DNA-binding NarL/FixJ family response regulator
MYTVVVGARVPDLLHRALAALIQELRPDWRVEIAETPPEQAADGAIRIEIAGTSRWMAIFTAQDDCAGAATALAEGAFAVLGVHGHVEQLEQALRATTEGGAPYIPAELARGLARRLLARGVPEERAPASPFPRLTPRERQVLELVAAGLSNREIAERLTLSVNTVRSHLQTLSTKLSASSRAKMVANAWVSGLQLAPDGLKMDTAAS